jgi:hypothetical protein
MKYQYLLVVTRGLEHNFMKHRSTTVFFSSNIYIIFNSIPIRLKTADFITDWHVHIWPGYYEQMISFCGFKKLQVIVILYLDLDSTLYPIESY